MSVLRTILDSKVLEVELAKATIGLAEIERMAQDAPPVRPFRAALEQAQTPLALIAEVKKASPSKGLIRPGFDPAAIAEAYRDAGAHCLSVLTDERYFKGSRQNLDIARSVSGLPCLRKDFIFDPYQVYESRAWGADCILLIVAAFEDQPQLHIVAGLAKALEMDVLFEVHSRPELDIALALGADLIGVNNRDLGTMKTSLSVSETLLPLIPPGVVGVSESALETTSDLARVQEAGARAVLIGTAFCAAADVGAKVREVMGW
ncbi:MAG TPA: indole-3-glycerol phosphate synthase TrpC [Fimbriimonadaceae bacterium]|nr:indole-3-glycerol phosphate synthase TrpC [Fimbriimonadaceae bacterium]